MLLLEDLMHEQFKSLLRANTGVAAAFHYTRSRPPLNVLPLFDSLGDAEVEQLMRHCDDAAKKQDSTIGRFSHGLHWKVYYPEQLIAAHDSRIEHVVIITKGSVRMHFPVVDGPHARNEEHTVVASVGDALGVCELMLGLPRMSQLTADSMAQALLVPTATFLQLLGAVQGIRTRAWQATAAQLAAQHHHILGQHRQLAPLNIFFRNCTVERVQPGQVFEVPRTALLLTGSVRSLLPLPAEFHLRREHSAPASSIKATANGSAADRVNGSSGSLQELGRSGSSELLLSPKRQGSGSDSGSSSPKGSSPRGGSPGASVANLAAILEHPAHDQQQHDVVAHEVAAEAQAKEQQQQQQDDDARVLASPAELPPGDFSCLTEAMLLQVPRGFQMPTDLQTTTYQAQVLSKGSISVGVSGSAVSGAAAEGGLAGGAASAYSAGELGRHSKLVSPLAKSMGGMLARVSRLAGISRTASDSMPQMPFLQTALASMREQQQERARQDNMRRSSGGTAAAAAVRGYPLRSAAEKEAGVRLSNESPAASGAAAAPAAGAAGDIEMGVPETALGAAGGSSQPSPFAAAARNNSNGTTPAAVNAAGAGLSRLGQQQQQQQGVVMPRATDVVTGSRGEGRQAGGGSAGGILLSSNSLTRRSTGSLT
uniref:Cyclic nucleotide-binding domain-containing protein n=1 Tax=Tetradesmus obliquus TaxID=3088 RepID=A0A383VZP0_TETOB